MKRIHAIPLVLILGAAAGGGLIAVTQTASADTPAASTVAPTEITQREAQLAQIESELQAQLDQQPPKLPEVPSFAPVSEPELKKTKASAGKAASPQKVIVQAAATPAPAPAYEEHDEEEHEHEEGREYAEAEYEGGDDDD